MNTEILIAIGATLAGPLAIIFILLKENSRMGRELGELHRQMLHNQMVRETLDASVKTGSMLGPATLQQMKEVPKPEPPEEPKKRTGVVLSYGK